MGGCGGADAEAHPPRLDPAVGCDSPTVAQPDRLGVSVGAGGLGTAAGTVAQPAFLNPEGLLSLESTTGVDAVTTETGGFAILIPAALASLRSSFSSRLRSFSLRLLTSSSVLRLARCAACMSRKRAL